MSQHPPANPSPAEDILNLEPSLAVAALDSCRGRNDGEEVALPDSLAAPLEPGDAEAVSSPGVMMFDVNVIACDDRSEYRPADPARGEEPRDLLEGNAVVACVP